MDHFHLAEREPVAKAIAAAAACTSLDELDAAIRGYDVPEIVMGRPFMASQRSRIPGPGGIMVVTEKPEEEDLQTGKPFSGDYGNLMRETLKRSGVAQEDLHVAYAIRWTPHDEVSPNKTQISASRPFLFREIEIVRPRAIMAQGKAVIEALTMYRGNIQPIAGSTLQFKRNGEAIQCYVTFHPAFPLRISQQIPEFQNQVAGFFDQFGEPARAA